MSFAEEAAELLTTPYALYKFAQDVLSDEEEDDAGRKSSRNIQALLGTLGALGLLGSGAYAYSKYAPTAPPGAVKNQKSLSERLGEALGEGVDIVGNHWGTAAASALYGAAGTSPAIELRRKLLRRNAIGRGIDDVLDFGTIAKAPVRDIESLKRSLSTIASGKDTPADTRRWYSRLFGTANDDVELTQKLRGRLQATPPKAKGAAKPSAKGAPSLAEPRAQSLLDLIHSQQDGAPVDGKTKGSNATLSRIMSDAEALPGRKPVPSGPAYQLARLRDATSRVANGSGRKASDLASGIRRELKMTPHQLLGALNEQAGYSPYRKTHGMLRRMAVPALGMAAFNYLTLPATEVSTDPSDIAAVSALDLERAAASQATGGAK